MFVDDTSIYINPGTPGYARARIYPAGPSFDVIFDEPAEEDSGRPIITCAESDVVDVRTRETLIEINNTVYQVMSHPHRDQMGVATIRLQEE